MAGRSPVWRTSGRSRSGSLVPYGHRAPQVQSYIQSLDSARAWRKAQSAKRKIQRSPCEVTKAPRCGREAQGIGASLCSFASSTSSWGRGGAEGILSRNVISRGVSSFSLGEPCEMDPIQSASPPRVRRDVQVLRPIQKCPSDIATGGHCGLVFGSYCFFQTYDCFWHKESSIAGTK